MSPPAVSVREPADGSHCDPVVIRAALQDAVARGRRVQPVLVWHAALVSSLDAPFRTHSVVSKRQRMHLYLASLSCRGCSRQVIAHRA